MSSSSTKPDPPPLPPRVLVGRIVRPHGVRGELLVDVLSDLASRFETGRRLASRQGGACRELTIVRARPAAHGLLVSFAEVASRDEAEALRGAELEVERGDVPPAPEGEYYYFELIGALCVDARAGELGRVVELDEGPSGLLLLVENDAGRRLPLPFVEAFISGVDRAARRIDWRLPEGLIAACASRS